MRGGDLIYTASIVLKSTATTIYEKAFKNKPLGGSSQLTIGKKPFPEPADICPMTDRYMGKIRSFSQQSLFI
jgi:hypothetical protein